MSDGTLHSSRKLGEHELYRFGRPVGRDETDLTQGSRAIPNRKPFGNSSRSAAAPLASCPAKIRWRSTLELDDAERPFDAQHQLIVEIIHS